MAPRDDRNQVNAVAALLGMTRGERLAFGVYIHHDKELTGGGSKNARGDYTFQELLELGRLFLDEYRTP